jgi:hypothetical protein
MHDASISARTSSRSFIRPHAYACNATTSRPNIRAETKSSARADEWWLPWDVYGQYFSCVFLAFPTQPS